MDGPIFALLIGIDRYPGGIRPLYGCCNDINAVQTVLTGKLGVSRERLVRLAAPHQGSADFDGVPGQPPTRDNIVAALQALADGAITADDRIVIYFSGHGSSVELRGPQGGTLRESLVPVDVTVDATREIHNVLLDIDVIARLRAIAARTARVTVILDACHAAGATRGEFRGEPEDRPRNADLRGFVQAGTPRPEPGGIVRGLSGSLETVVVAAACQADETAKEGVQGDDLRQGGHFTAALLRVLSELDAAALADLRWGQIWRQVVARVEARTNQHPQLFGNFARRVFGGPPELGDPGFGFRREGTGYRLPVGELAGVTKGTVVGVYGGLPVVLPPRHSDLEKAIRLGTLRVTIARRGHSEAELDAGTTPAQLASGTRAQVLWPGKPSLSVAFEPPALLTTSLRDALAESPFIRIADVKEPPSLVVRECEDGQLALTDDRHGTGDDGAPLLFRFPAATPAPSIRALLERYGVYIAPVELARRCEDPPVGLLRLNLLDCTQLGTDKDGYVTGKGFDPQDPQLPVLARDDRGEGRITHVVTKYCVEVQNSGARTLHVTWIECGASGRVYVRGTADIQPGGRHVFWYDSDPGNPFNVELPPERSELLDRHVAIGTTASGVDLRYLASDHSFDAALKSDGIKDKDGGGRYPPKEMWTSAQLVVRTVRP